MKRLCKHCGRYIDPRGMAGHLRTHKAEIEAENVKTEPEKPKLPKWRTRTPVFSDGQVGMRIPRAQIEKGWK